MSRFISYNQAFNWVDKAVDRSVHLQWFNEAITASTNFHDNLYFHPDLYNEGSGSLNLFIAIWAGYDSFKIQFPWIKEPEFQVLSNFHSFVKPTPNNSKTLSALTDYTGEDDNAWFGVYSYCDEYLIYNNSTWEEFHNKVVTAFTFHQRKTNFNYFNRFYVAKLTLSRNQIQQEIEAGHVNGSITGIHPALIPFEQIHVHFNENDNCALNIDGTWKHKVAGFIIPEEACRQLNEWGFKLPDEYYRDI